MLLQNMRCNKLAAANVKVLDLKKKRKKKFCLITWLKIKLTNTKMNDKFTFFKKHYTILVHFIAFFIYFQLSFSFFFFSISVFIILLVVVSYNNPAVD